MVMLISLCTSADRRVLGGGGGGGEEQEARVVPASPAATDNNNQQSTMDKNTVVKREEEKDGEKREEKKKQRRSVQWREVIADTKYIVEEDESESEDSVETESTMVSDTSTTTKTSTTSNASSRTDTLAPSVLYSTRRRSSSRSAAHYRLLTNQPHPLFPSEQLQNGPATPLVAAAAAAPAAAGGRVCARLQVDTVAGGAGRKMSSSTAAAPSSARYSTPRAELVVPLGRAATVSPVYSPAQHNGSQQQQQRRRIATCPSPASSMTSLTSSVRRSSESLPAMMTSSRRSSSTSSVASSASAAAAAPAACSSPTRFAVSGVVAGGSRLEAGLEGVYQLLGKTHSCQIRQLHVQTADPILADMIGKRREHMSTEFKNFQWPHLLTDKAKEMLRQISALTIMIDVTIEHVPEKESIFKRVSHRIKSVFSFFRRFA